MKNIAIITGASSGLGHEFCHQLDEGHGGPISEIWAIARNAERLKELVQTYTNIKIRPLVLDLTKDESFDELKALLEEEKPEVEWLINCAGFGTFGSFASVGDKNSAMVRLNCLALVSAITCTLPYMSAGSRIINVSSIAGLIPQVQLACYSATKAFVVELSRMLDHELKGTGIRVIAICPKFMKTRFLDKPGDTDEASRMTRIGYNDVENVAFRALKYAVLGTPVMIPSHDMRLAAFVAKHIPRKALFVFEDLLFGRN